MATLHKLGKLVTLKSKIFPYRNREFVTEYSFFWPVFLLRYPSRFKRKHWLKLHMCTRAAQHDQTHKVLTTDQKQLDFVANFQQKFKTLDFKCMARHYGGPKKTYNN
jgi:hypothetical protein